MTTRLRFRIDFDDYCSVGFGKIELLETIARTGSLSQAAREMDMSYRRAWLLVDSMNTGFDQPVTSAITGGSGGGGAKVTEFGRQLIEAFRELQPKLIALADKQMREIAQHAVKDKPKRASSAPKSPRRSMARSSRAAAK